MPRLLPVVILLLVVVAGVIALWHRPGAPTSPAAPDAKATAPTSTADDHKSAVRSAYLTQREKIRDALARNKDHPSNGSGVAQARRGSTANSASGATLDAQYMGQAIRDILPLMKQCFEHARDAMPDLGPVTFTVKFTIIADPTFGGVVDTSEIVPNEDGASAPDNPDLAECVSQTVYALRFPPPADDGRDEVVIPFSYRPNAPKP